MYLADTHCHISDKAFSSEEDAYIERALQAGVGLMLHPDVDSSERTASFELADRHPDVVKPMLGLYPGSVDRNWMDEIERMVSFHETRTGQGKDICAIGEIGLDYHWGKEYASEQKDALVWQLEFAARLGLPVNVHLRDAMEDFISVLKACRHLNLRGNLHAYSGSYESFIEIQKLGDWRIGVGGVVTFRKASIAEVVRRVPLERIVLETDAPYLTPVPHRGERNESSLLPIVAEKVAALKDVPVEEVARVTTANAVELFNINTKDSVNAA